jgi:NADH-ubiquinone oxidoreductase chain 3
LVLFGFFLKSFKNFLGFRELRRGFECGFDGKSLSRVPFSLRFFLILILFLIFDLEIVLFLQFPVLKLRGVSYYFFRVNVVLIVLFFGTLEEWRSGFLS